jgi:hypothetical protein
LTATKALVIYDMILHRRVNITKLSTECVSWPDPKNQTKAGCEAGGAALHDGGVYHYNTGRGTAASVCAKQPDPAPTCKNGCLCCRTGRDKMDLADYTFAMEVTISQTTPATIKTDDASLVPRCHAFTGTLEMVSNPERGVRHEIHGGCGGTT